MRPERLAVIQARDEELGGLCAPDCAGEECQAERDRRELLDMVRELQARLDKVAMLAEQWRYKGEFGWGAWQEGEGPDREGLALDRAAAELRAALTATEGAE